tara:strand:- start:284 stop:484 length:201 start_codon:yes stop_codon:yes gene_type:complete
MNHLIAHKPEMLIVMIVRNNKNDVGLRGEGSSWKKKRHACSQQERGPENPANDMHLDTCNDFFRMW